MAFFDYLKNYFEDIVALFRVANQIELPPI
jgi:hypothetical protein